MSDLALLGGPKTIDKPFTRYNSIGIEEMEAVQAVIKSGVLSGFLGSNSPAFYGGPKVQEFERQWSDYFDIEYSVSVNSNTSGLITALGAVGIEPGDEVIVSPWTMSASATSILVWNAIPVFADIERETFNLDPASIEKNITPYTKAIMVPDIFGQGANLDAIAKVANKNGLKVIEDCAQAPGALYKGKYCGTVADIGVFSLNCHKHIHTGEGGMCVTDNREYARRMRLIRNHAEAVVEGMGISDLSNMIGFNFRMTEIEAAIGIEQLKKLECFLKERIQVANRLTEGLNGLKGLTTPVVMANCTHVYYVYPLLIDESQTHISRELLVKALRAEGTPISDRYANLHLQPMFQKKIAYGNKGFPWSADFYNGDVSYDKGICPVAERLQEHEYLGIGLCVNQYRDEDTDMIIKAFNKVWNGLEDLWDLDL